MYKVRSKTHEISSIKENEDDKNRPRRKERKTLGVVWLLTLAYSSANFPSLPIDAATLTLTIYGLALIAKNHIEYLSLNI